MPFKKLSIKEILKQSDDKPQERSLTFQVSKEKIDEDNRTVELSFSSETPGRTWFGWEILDHKSSSVRLGRLNDGAPVGWLHFSGDVRGVVQKAWIDAARGRAVVRFGKSAAAEELFQDVKDGIKRNISVVFQRYKMVLEKEEEGEEPVYRTVDWEPLAVDFVPIAEDATVGVGRNKQVKENNEKENKENRTMEKCQICGKELVNGVCPDGCAAKAKDALASKSVATVTINEKEVSEKARKAEQTRVSEIMTIGKQHNCALLAEKAIAEGATREAFQETVLKEVYKAKPINTTADKEEGIPEKDARAFSISDAIKSILAGTWEKGGREKEMSDQVAKLVGREPGSFFIPYSVMLHKRDIFDSSGNAGAGSIATNLLVGSFIEALRKRTMVMQMGATVLPGLVGDVAIPKQTASVTVQWKAESVAADRSRPKIEQLAMTPKTITGYSDISRKLLKQSSMAVEPFVQNDLIRAIRAAIDLAALNGAGSSTEPEGILKTSGIGAVVSSGTLTWQHCVDLWTAVADEDADFGALGYLTNAFVIGKLMTTDKATNAAKFIVENLPDINGMTALGGQRCGVSNQVPKTIDTNHTALIYGNWADLIIGMWGGLDVLVDPYSQSSTGAVRIVVHQDIDTLIRHAESFSASQDIATV
ncbi:MAG: phage major capsid protein [Candidatus Omnitrophica bacterium]|nr:phage major capsid protein [Candidatus Omnitrophota bacterium]